MLLETYRYHYTWTSPLNELSTDDLHDLTNKELLAVFQTHKQLMFQTLIIQNRSNTHGESLAELVNTYNQYERTIPAISDVIRYQNQLYFTAARLNDYDQSLSQFYCADAWLTPDLSNQVVNHRIEVRHQINIDKTDFALKRTTLKPQLTDIFKVIVNLQTNLPTHQAEQLKRQVQAQLQTNCLEPSLTKDQLPFTCQPLNALV